MKARRFITGVASATAMIVVLTGCAATSTSGSQGGGSSSAVDSRRVVAIGAESQYTSVISQIGGKYVSATSVMSDPNTDPHSFEASARVASQLSGAALVVQNGLGYDGFMDKIEAASPAADRVVISAQQVLGLPDGTRNPHLWYDPKTMPAVAKRVAAALTKLQPAHAAYFAANLTKFTASLAKWTDAIAAFGRAHPNVPVATTEPVADYLLEAAGTDNRTPWAFQASIMNDTDPAPQDVAIQSALFTGHKVKVFLYNQQVTDAITATYLKLAKQNGIPVVGVYETMPARGYNYQTWMEAELAALTRAVTDGVSTEKL